MSRLSHSWAVRLTRSTAARFTSTPMESCCPRKMSSLTRKSAFCRSRGPWRMSRSLNSAATSQARSASPNGTARSIMCARRGCSGSSAIRRAWSVGRPSAEKAPSWVNKSLAWATAPVGGGVSHDSSAGSRAPHWARSSMRGVRSASRISGGRRGASIACSFSVHSR